MKKILAVSGGVDSMVLLEMFRDEPEVIVAHFDHGIRENSSEDVEFVQKICSEYKVKCVVGSGNLGSETSEEGARKARYEFLRKVAENEDREIYTAHHQDDLIESVAINLIRGTGWRGLAPMGNDSVKRPLLKMSKKEIWEYAGRHNVRFREDQTNNDPKYLRNRMREALKELPEENEEKLVKLIEKQREMRVEIDGIIAEILPEDKVYQREWFDNLDDGMAMEILRAALLKAGVRATRVQILDFLRAIRTYAPEKKFNLPDGKLLILHKKFFVL